MAGSEFIQRMKEAVGHIAKARDIMSQGPLDYYLGKLVEHSEALLTRFAPLKIGQPVVIVGKIKCEGGWAGCKRTLAMGATGTVSSVDYCDGRFVFEFVPDHEYWTDRDGVEHEATVPHTYSLGDDKLAARPTEPDAAAHAD